MNHNRAQAYCRSQEPTSYLADITSEEEFAWLKKFVNDTSVWVK